MSVFFDSSPLRVSLSSSALVLLAAMALSLGGCEELIETTGSIAAPANPKPTSDANMRAEADELGRRYNSDPGDKSASINYARALRALTRYTEAAAVMQTAAVRSPHDLEVLGEFGKALADLGELAQAKDVLTHAYTPDRPSPTLMSVQGVVEDKLGDHEGARTFYRDALRISPGDPAILNNLGLSYLLSKQLPQAEAALREANASPQADARERDNLAFVLELQGKFAKARINRAQASATATNLDALTIRRAPERAKQSLLTGPTDRLADASE
jgi:Flp pilus assembly protein TadD